MCPRPNPHPAPASLRWGEKAPFVYFDGASAFGTNFGAIQVELAANILVAIPGGVRTDIVTTAHLRCSPNAAADLRQAIDKALAMLAQPQPQSEGKPN
jgi:hypothetical protein